MSSAATAGCCKGQAWCTITCTSELLSRKWHTIIVHTLLERGTARFTELKRSIEAISGKVLAESLDDLVDKGLVSRTVVDPSPRRVEYELTPAGKDLEPVVEAMEAWGQEHLDPQGRRLGVEDPEGNRVR